MKFEDLLKVLEDQGLQGDELKACLLEIAKGIEVFLAPKEEEIEAEKQKEEEEKALEEERAKEVYGVI